MESSNKKYDIVVRIPPVDKDTRIGSVFNHIFSIIFQTEQTIIPNDGNIIWDFSNWRFLHPFFIGAISILKRQYSGKIEIRGVPNDISRYFDVVYFSSPLIIHTESNDSNLWERYNGKSYLPICLFNPNDESSVKAQELIQKAINQQLGFSKDLIRVISLLLAELIDNITEHSKSKDGYIFRQKIPRENSLYIMICDTGRSIYSSFASNDKYHDKLTHLESSGLLMALSGRSTKDLPDCENRGHGISKSIKMVVTGLGGGFFILSGSAFARHDSSGEKVADLPGEIRWNGTAILLKLPSTVPSDFNVYKYIS